MKNRHIFLATAGALMLLPLSAWSHDVPNISHTHAIKQTAYGKYRVGHSVNGPLGSITIWSPQTYTGYQNVKTVKFARPEPITKAPGAPVSKVPGQTRQVKEYGKR